MTAQNRATLKSEFETGDVPDGTNYADLIDSSLNLVDTSAQSVASDVTFAGAVNITGTLGSITVSGAVTADSITVSGAVSANSVNASSATFTTLTVDGQAVRGRSYGECYLTATAATTIASAGEYNLAKGTTSAEAAFLSDFTHASPFRLTYTGSATKTFSVSVVYSVTAAGNNKLSSFRIAKNGTTLAKSEIDRFISTGADVGAGGLQVLVELTANSFVEVYLTNKTDTVGISVEKANVIALEV